MARIQISDLSLRAVIGTNNWERKNRQDVLINVTMDYDASQAARTDHIKDAVDYKTITKRIIKTVEGSHFHLLEKLADTVLKAVMSDKKVKSATVRIDKPHALRFARSVSMELTTQR
ncbi:MAG: dihydroneopterin aldolase [Candidatus Omnitrophica bacterium]|nr:dihydroneopterin aldolase [Candidatus Omnitrophota bacterium]